MQTELTIGSAITYCCHEDLEVIETEERLKEIQDEYDEELPYESWPSAKEAYLELATRWPQDSEEHQECLRLYSQE